MPCNLSFQRNKKYLHWNNNGKLLQNKKVFCVQAKYIQF